MSEELIVNVEGRGGEHISKTLTRAINERADTFTFHGVTVPVFTGDDEESLDKRWGDAWRKVDEARTAEQKQAELDAIAEIHAEGVAEGRQLEREEGRGGTMDLPERCLRNRDDCEPLAQMESEGGERLLP